jgi:hypothetical protein|tara:strand:- start:25736 stop:26326 length:591 start_codon:yes stop_codon:yes gene_type:complete
MFIEEIETEKLKPYTNNPRIIPEVAITNVANSIKKFGWQQPIVIDEENNIIVGHTRYLASKKLLLKKVPVKKINGLSPDDINAYRLLDNKLNEFTSWETNILDFELEQIKSKELEKLLSVFKEEELEIKNLNTDFQEIENNEEKEKFLMDDNFVNLNFTMTQSEKQICTTKLKKIMEEKNIDTMSNALVNILKNER